MGQGPKSTTWSDVGNDADPEELLLRNTYLNGLAQKTDKNELRPFNYTTRKVVWADNNNFNNKGQLCSVNLGKELMYQKDIKPVVSHKKSKPMKSSLKTRSHSADLVKKLPSSQIFSSNLGKISDSMNITSSITANTKDSLISGSSMINNFNNVNKIASSVNFSDNSNNAISSKTANSTTSNDLLKNYTNLGGMFSHINTNHSETNHYLMNKSLHQSEKLNENVKSGINNNYPSSLTSNQSGNLNSTNNYSNTSSSSQPNIPSSLYNVNNSGSVNNIKNSSQIQNVNSSINQNLSSNSSLLANTRQNNFSGNNNNPQQRSYSVGNDPEKSKTGTSSNNKGETNIIIASKYKNVVHNSYNNIYIQSPQDLDRIYGNTNQNSNFDSNNNNQNSGSNSAIYNNNPTRNMSQGKKETQVTQPQNYIPNLGATYSGSNNLMNNSFKSNDNTKNYASNISNNSSNIYSKETQNQNVQIQPGKLTKSGDNQRMLQNNFFSNNSSFNQISMPGSNMMD